MSVFPMLYLGKGIDPDCFTVSGAFIACVFIPRIILCLIFSPWPSCKHEKNELML